MLPPESPAPALAKIALTGLRKAFGPKIVLDGVDLAVNPGESLVIIGGSGTGKSVLLKCLLGLLAPDGGTIAVDGEETTHLSGRKRTDHLAKFGMLFQGAALFDSLPVWHNVAFRLLGREGLSRREARAKALATLASVGLGPEVADLAPAELSGGMQKRVGLARAIAARPDILLFDEPTTGLDPIMADVINELIVKSVRELGSTALSITHDMASAHKIADRMAMLHEGRIIWSGPKREIDHSGNPFVDQFIHGRAEGPIHMQVRGG